MKRNVILAALTATAPLVAAPAVTRAADPDVSKEVIAVQLRKQGFECKKPLSAQRDKADSAADAPAWILMCEGVTYRVVLVPKQAAKVERLTDEDGGEGKPAGPSPPQQP